MRVVIAKVINYSSNAKILKNKLQVKKITNYKREVQKFCCTFPTVITFACFALTYSLRILTRLFSCSVDIISLKSIRLQDYLIFCGWQFCIFFFFKCVWAYNNFENQVSTKAYKNKDMNFLFIIPAYKKFITHKV